MLREVKENGRSVPEYEYKECKNMVYSGIQLYTVLSSVKFVVEKQESYIIVGMLG